MSKPFQKRAQLKLVRKSIRTENWAVYLMLPHFANNYEGNNEESVIWITGYVLSTGLIIGVSLIDNIPLLLHQCLLHYSEWAQKSHLV